MSAYLTLVSSLILIGVLYQIRLLRRMNGSLIKLASPERDIRRIAKAEREASRENYRQSEYYAQLIKLLDLKAPIPATRSWAASPDVLLTLLGLAKSSKPARILDLGSGMSTLQLLSVLITQLNMQVKRRNFLHPMALPMLIFVLHLLHRTHQVWSGMTYPN
jgi:hypothetical protein